MTDRLHVADIPVPICAQCGQPHLAYDGKLGCKAHKSGDPTTPCSQHPIAGAAVCWSHGGAAASTKTAAARELAKRRAVKLLDSVRTYGEQPTETNPAEGIHLLICWSRTHVDWLRERVQELLPSALIWGDRKVIESDLHGLTIEQRAEIHAWLGLYYKEREFFLTTCARAIHAGLAEREVRLEEERGALIAEIIRGILADLELTPPQQARALSVVPTHLRRAVAEAG